MAGPLGATCGFACGMDRELALGVGAGLHDVDELAELGVTEVKGAHIEYPRHGMTVGFSAPYFDPERPLRFEYRLTGRGTWTAAGAQRSIVGLNQLFRQLHSRIREVASVILNRSLIRNPSTQKISPVV